MRCDSGRHRLLDAKKKWRLECPPLGGHAACYTVAPESSALTATSENFMPSTLPLPLLNKLFRVRHQRQGLSGGSNARRKLRKVGRLFTVLVAAATLAACSGSVTDADAPLDSSALQQQVAGDIAAAHQNAKGVWPGFELTDVPIVAIATQDSSSGWAVVAGHPEVTTVGNAALIDGYEDVWLVTDIETPIPTPSNGIFDFDVPVAGVPSFVLAADHAFELAPPGTEAFVSIIEHEAFHIFQEEWDPAGYADQQVEYDLSPENLELALAEDAALVAAIEATNDQARRTAIEHFLAIRSMRLEKFASTELDEGQEWVEGTAHWYEFLAGPALAPPYADAIIEVSAADPGTFDGKYMDPKQYFSWQRFYFSGAALLEAMTQLGMGPFDQRLAEGMRPADIARSELNFSEKNRDALLAEAMATYDSEGELSETAEALFAAREGADSVESDADGDPTAVEIDDDLRSCLQENGVSIDADTEIGAAGIEITDEAAENCF